MNPGPGKAPDGDRYAAVTVAHCESVLRGFYDFHLEAGTGPMLNPFPLARAREGNRARAHHKPMEPFSGQRRGRYRPKVATRAPRAIPDAQFDLRCTGTPGRTTSPNANQPEPGHGL